MPSPTTCVRLLHRLAILHTPPALPGASAFEGERRANLVAGLVQLRSIKAHTKSQRGTSIELSAIRKRRNTPIIDLELRKAQRIELILARQLNTTRSCGLHIITDLDARLSCAVDLLVVARGNDAEVLCALHSCDVGGCLIPECEGVFRYSGFLHIVSCLTSDQEAIMSRYDIDERVDIAGGLRIVNESAGVNGRVLEGEGEFLRGARSFAWVPKVLEVELDTRCDDVGEFELGVEEGGGSEDLGDSEACMWMPEC